MSSLLGMLISHRAYFKYFSLADLAYEPLDVTEQKCPSATPCHTRTQSHFFLNTEKYLFNTFLFYITFILIPLSCDIPAVF